MIIYVSASRFQRWKKLRKSRREVAALLPKDYTLPITLIAGAMVIAFWMMFFGWWLGAGAEEMPNLPCMALVKMNDPNSELNVRKGAGFDYPIVNSVAWHETVRVDVVLGEWALICYPKSPYPIGWANLKYLVLEK